MHRPSSDRTQPPRGSFRPECHRAKIVRTRRDIQRPAENGAAMIER
jgi:hypothetical protein